jgi:hypothetical protein
MSDSPASGPVAHPNGDGAIQSNHRARFDAQQRVVRPHHLRPVGGCGDGHFSMNCGNGSSLVLCVLGFGAVHLRVLFALNPYFSVA